MKQKVKELFFLLKYNWSLYLFSIIILSLLAIVISLTMSMIVQTFHKEQATNAIYQGKKIFHISDTLIEADDFSNFRSKAQNINKIAHFYNALVESDQIQFISTYDQPVYIENFKGGENFLYNKYIENNMYNIKSMQMNSSAYQFYGIRLKEGIEPDWEKIDADEDIIPVVLGSDYSNIYTIGDEFSGFYYPKSISFKVVGFLEENQAIYYQGNAEFYLDTYILVPYPYRCSEVILPNSEEMTFKGILYFAMINSNIATSFGEVGVKEITNKISYQTEFYDHLLIGESLFSVQYSRMASVITANKNLLIAFMSFAIIFSIAVQCGISLTIKNRRNNFYVLCAEIGIISLQNDIKLVLLFPYIIAFVISALFLEFYAKELVILSIVSSGLALLLIGLICNLYIQLNKNK